MGRSLLAVAVSLLALLGLFVAPAAAQFQVLVTDDFENGLQNWTIEDITAPPQPLWHVAEPGECGLGTSRMAAYCLPDPVCTYAPVPGDSFSNLRSEPFLMTGQEPFHLQVEGIWGFDNGPVGNSAASTPYLEDTVTGINYFLLTFFAMKQQPGVLVKGSTDFSMPPSWANHPVRLCFQGGSHTTQASIGNGIRFDNVLLRSSAYEKFGEGVAGINPYTFEPLTPALSGYGPLTRGSANELRLTSLRPNTTAVLVFGLASLDQPFKGGVMYPEPGRLWVIPTGDVSPGFTSHVTVPFTLPVLAPGLALFMQCWVQDPSAPEGWASSRGLKGVTT